MKKVLALMLAAVMAVAMVACGAKNDVPAAEATLDTQVIEAGKLYVGMSADYPPFESLDEDGNLIGYDVDMVKWLVEHMYTEDGTPYTVEFVQMEFSTIISALQTGQIDLGVAAFSYNPERQCDFSDPYYLSAQAVAVKADSDIYTLADLNGKFVLAGEGTVGFEAASELEGVTVGDNGDYLQQFEAVRLGQADAVVCDFKVAEGYAAGGEYRVLEETLAEDNLCITIQKGNDKIVEAVNAAVAEFVSSGTSDQYKANWDL